MMQGAPPMAPQMAFNPQQMLNFAQPMAHPQPPQMPQLPQMPQYPGLSDADVMRIATQMKLLLTDEINRLVEQRVAIAIEPIKRELTQLQTEVKQQTLRNDDLEQYSRRSCLRVSGIVETTNEDVNKIVLDLGTRVGANISPEDIDRAHRVGMPVDAGAVVEGAGIDISDQPREQHRNREIIIKFSNYGARLRFLKGRAALRDQNAKIYINEDLTKKRKNIVYECRKLKKAKIITKTWVYNGNVYVQDRSDNKVRVTSIEDIDNLRMHATGGAGTAL